MAVSTRDQEVLDALRVVRDPDLHRDIVSLGFVQELRIDPSGAVAFTINLTTPACPVKDDLRDQARIAVARLPWVTDVQVKMTANTAVARGQGSTTPLIPRVKNVVAVASGKGGVGKSTTSVNLAVALSQTGARVGLPPGTGDAPLSLSQLIPLSGVVIVTTPQDVALQDVAKGMAMFKQLEVPVIGVIENMSYFVCPNCSEKHELFGRGGGERIAKAFGVPFLGQIPLQPNVRLGGDEGQPVVIADPDSPAAKALNGVAGEVARQVSVLAFQARGNFVPLGGLTIRKT